MIVQRVKAMLASPAPADQRLSLEVIRRLAIKFPLPDVIDLLDVPELSQKALEVLREGSGQDLGADKQAWGAFFERRM